MVRPRFLLLLLFFVAFQLSLSKLDYNISFWQEANVAFSEEISSREESHSLFALPC